MPGRSSAAAVPVATATYVPLALVSGIFFPGQAGPTWLVHATSLMPMRPLTEALQACFSAGAGLAFSPGRLAVLVAWTVAGTLCAVRCFRWLPTGSAG